MAACRRYLRVAPRDFITFEYVMLGGINDSLADADHLAALVRREHVPCKFNLIPFNPFRSQTLKSLTGRRCSPSVAGSTSSVT